MIQKKFSYVVKKKKINLFLEDRSNIILNLISFFPLFGFVSFLLLYTNNKLSGPSVSKGH